MTLGSGSTAQSCTGTTNAAGNASCTIADREPDGRVGARSRSPSPATPTTGRPAPRGARPRLHRSPAPSSGGFEVGDRSAGVRDQRHPGELLGFAVLEDQLVQRRGQRPGVHEGLHRQRARLRLRRCNWTSDPGNSSHPPSTIPVNMLVVVSSTTSPSRARPKSGNIKHLVVVSVQPGYAGQPGARRMGKDHRHHLLSGHGPGNGPGMAIR